MWLWITFIVAPSGECLLVAAAVSTLHLFDLVTLTFNFLTSNEMGDQDLSCTIYLPSLVLLSGGFCFRVLTHTRTHPHTHWAPLSALLTPSSTSTWVITFMRLKKKQNVKGQGKAGGGGARKKMSRGKSQGHKTRCVTWPLYSQYMVFCRWSFETIPLSRMIDEILCANQTFVEAYSYWKCIDSHFCFRGNIEAINVFIFGYTRHVV